MPMIDVETNSLSPPIASRFAKTVSLWLHGEGIPINHVIIRFRALDASMVFSGPYPFEHFHRNDKSAAGFAFVTCSISYERPQRFRTALAGVVTDALRPEIDPKFVFITLRPVDPQDWLVGGATGETDHRGA